LIWIRFFCRKYWKIAFMHMEKLYLQPFWPEETDNWLKPHDSIQCQSYSLVTVTEWVFKIHQGQYRTACCKEDSCNLQTQLSTWGTLAEALVKECCLTHKMQADLWNDMAIEEESNASAVTGFAWHPD
jgi:hypothetical protein